ncbi:MAG: PilN domain-containing protein [bacterium]|nr:PilN domain-containing protein [bacterium]
MESFSTPNNNNRFNQSELSTEKVAVGWPWRLLFFSFFIFLLSFFVFFGLRYGYQNYLEDQIQFFDSELAKLSSKVSLEDQERFINFYSQLFNLQRILEDHPYSSNLFRFLEKNIVNSVYFSDALFKRSENTVTLKGMSNNFENLSGQLALLEKSSELAKTTLNNVSLQKDGVSFSVSLTFKPEFFKQLSQ